MERAFIFKFQERKSPEPIQKEPKSRKLARGAGGGGGGTQHIPLTSATEDFHRG